MTLKKVLVKSGVNRENTRYYTEGGWYDCDKIRFRQGTPQKLGGWVRTSSQTFSGVCRSLWAWQTLNQVGLTGVGTSSKFYVSRGGYYYDITPIRAATNLTSPFVATNGSTTITVTASSHGCLNGDFVTFNGATSLGGVITAAVLNTEFQITLVDVNTYTITSSVAANGSDTGTGGSPRAVYQINTGPVYQAAINGWGSGGWGLGTWGNSIQSSDSLRLWSQSNYGQDLVFGPRGSALYYYYASRGVDPLLAAITIATPAVITAPNYYVEGAPVAFTTSGALPTGLETGITYYARNYTSGVFNVSATPTGALINTSGTSRVRSLSPNERLT